MDAEKSWLSLVKRISLSLYLSLYRISLYILPYQTHFLFVIFLCPAIALPVPAQPQWAATSQRFGCFEARDERWGWAKIQKDKIQYVIKNKTSRLIAVQSMDKLKRQIRAFAGLRFARGPDSFDSLGAACPVGFSFWTALTDQGLGDDIQQWQESLNMQVVEWTCYLSEKTSFAPLLDYTCEPRPSMKDMRVERLFVWRKKDFWDPK